MRRTAVLLLPLTVALMSGGAAEAKTYSHTDPAGDVWFGPGNPVGGAPAPHQVEGDVRKVVIRHHRRDVQMVMTLRDIKPDTRRSSFVFHLQNRRKVETGVGVEVSPNAYPHGLLTISDELGEPRQCRGAKHFSVNYTTGTVAVTIPRSCVGSPKFLRARAYASVIHTGDTDGYRDDALSTRDAYKSPVVWTPWIRRG